MNIYKIKSFTLYELMVALIIFSILTAMSYYIVQFITRNFIRYNKAIDSFNQIIILDEMLSYDFETSNFICLKNKNIQFIKNDDTITYTLLEKPNYLIRVRNNKIDSFQVAIEKINYDFLIKHKNIIYSMQLHFENYIINQLSYYKLYDYKKTLRVKNEEIFKLN